MQNTICLPVLLAALFTTPLFAQNAATSVAVDANANRHAINPNIYGIAYGDAGDMKTLNAPLNRWGGNSTSRYNWQIDAHSAGADYYFETYPDGSGAPAASADTFVATTRALGGAQPMFSIPMIDYLANLGPNRSTLEGFSVKKYGQQQAVDPYNTDAGNGVSASTGKNITGNNPADTGVANSTTIQQGWLQHFVSNYGTAANGGIQYYLLDNEPSLWNSTHRDVHPSPANYQEMYNKIVAYASAIRATDPSAKIGGPEEWSWWAMYDSGFDQANNISSSNSDYNTHNQTYYYPWLLENLYAYQQKTGTRMLDILTVHCYNQTPSDNDDSLAGQQIRNRETRILWDPTFKDPSWYGQIGINNSVVNWISTLKSLTNQYYPGLQVGCTEYNWGDEPNLNGATTQADVLGIYGREGLDLATRWTVAKNNGTTPATYYVTYLASQIYRNYDGNRSTFGDQSVSATVANPDNLSAFASVRTSDGALTVMLINKQQGSVPVNLSLANFSSAGTAQVWQVNSASQTSIAHLANIAVTGNAIATTLPSQSITLLVIPEGTTVTPTGTVFLTGQTPGPLRNNYSGFVGFAFTVGGSALQVSSLGRFTAAGNAGSHLLKLVQSNGADVTGGSATVTMGGAVAGQYQYATLTSPVTLAANTTYYLLSAETAGGDQWYDIGGVTSTSDANVIAPVYSYGSGAYYSVPGMTAKAYVPVNFLFSTTTVITPPVNPPAAGTSFVTAQTPGALRNNFSGLVGFSFTPSSAITLTSLGRYVAPGNNGTHLLQVVSVNNSGSATVFASASLSLAGATAGQFSYASLNASVTLPANVTYYLTSQETAGGDSWYDIGPVTVTGVASVLAPVYTDGHGNYVPVAGLPGQSYVPVSFQYQTANTTPVAGATALFTDQTPGPLRNNYSGFVGTALKVGATPLTVSSLGRFYVAGNSGTHILKLVLANGADLAGGSVAVSVASGTAGQYSYAALAAPVTLQANATYYLLSQESSGGDFWHDLGPITPTAAAQVTGAVYSYGSGSYFLVPGMTNYSYVPVNLLYQ